MSGSQKSEIKNIIFDLGGVLLNINPLLSLLELENISGIRKEELIVRFDNEQIFEKFDTGNLSSAQFRNKLCKILNQTVTDSEIDRIWNKLILDIPPHRVKLLQELRKNYSLFLLSNTNSIHFEYYTREFFGRYGMHLVELFDQVFVSHKIGIHKPDAGIYTYVLETAGIASSETLFIDDSRANVEAAGLLGMSGIHIRDFDVIHYFENGILKG